MALLDAIPDSPDGRQLIWYLGLIISNGESASLANRDHFTPELARTFGVTSTDEQEKLGWRGLAARMGEITSVAVAAASEFKIQCEMTSKDRRWRLYFAVEESPPHRIIEGKFERQFDSKIEVREATESDGAVLAEIERRCPIELRDTSIYFDRGDDYFAFARLMEEVTVGIAFLDGVAAAVSCGALHPMRIGGVIRSVMTVTHLRVLPEFQRKGLWGAVNRALEKYRSRYDGSCAYVSVHNAGMQHGFINTPNKWSTPAFRVQLPCAELADGVLGKLATGRPATRADAPAIVELLNNFHGREETFVPYTEESFIARLERAPKQYSWDQLWINDKAAVGVWPAGDSLKVVMQNGDRRTESRRGIVLDYAFAPGGEKDFEALLRAWCAHLLARGMDTLSMFTSPTSPGSTRICGLAGEIEPFNMWTPEIEEPAGAEGRGLYVDPIYF